MKRIVICLFVLVCLFLCGCGDSQGAALGNTVDATEHGVLPENTPIENSKNLQRLIDSLSFEGGTVYLPRGVYRFAEGGSQTIGSHCIKMRSNVGIKGDGDTTVLMPVGDSSAGLDMFYFNDYLDTGSPKYLERCRFEDFVIDGSETSSATYTSAGKGFMFNLFRDCHWKRVTVKNTDATGFGVDCPVDSTIVECRSENCGKAAKDESAGASGFGIGFGYSDVESIRISDCTAVGNKKFGFFFEHQGRFDRAKYTATKGDFRVTGCEAEGNLHNFGGIFTLNTVYENCSSGGALKYGYYFENSAVSTVLGSSSLGDADASFAVSYTGDAGPVDSVFGIEFVRSSSEDTLCGVRLINCGEPEKMSQNSVTLCSFRKVDSVAYAEGKIKSQTFSHNVAEGGVFDLSDSVEELVNSFNSWNLEP